MIFAAVKALGDVASPPFRSILWKAIGFSLLLFMTLFVGVEAFFWAVSLFPYPWLEALAAIGAGLGLLVAFFFLMVPVTALFAGLYQDEVAARVEARHYSNEKPGVALPPLRAMKMALQFGLLVLMLNLLALPLVFTGFGAIVLIVINAYLLSREYFEMAAMRFLPSDEAKNLRRENAVAVFSSGLLPAVMALVPLLNLIVPIFATSYFTHIFKQVQRSSA